ncbi:MAG: Cof-type HAD-IIB family hydrolase [Treponema sp.]|nr:Cof-type HAD-IIB family hydrolase [Treponema sp.]
MENISLILSDLDGTLFHDNKSISDYSKTMIARAQKKGVKFGVCTARARVNAIKFLDGLNPDFYITNGGGLVTLNSDSNGKYEKLYTCEFSIQEIRTLIDAAFKTCGPDINISVDNESGVYCNTKEELSDRFWIYNDFSDFNQTGMKFCMETLDIEKVRKVASTVGIESIDYLPFSDIPWYKLSKKNATKEKAIEVLCNFLKIQPSRIAAFGDDFNDIGMLKLCGKGIAMKNAISEVREIADEVCGSNEEDGVAKWIENNIL